MRITLLPAVCLAAVLATACPGPGANPNDADGDGVQTPDDCDDQDPDIHPGAIEACDGLDNDCDGFIDEGVTDEWFQDADGDGYGDPLTKVEACDVPEGEDPAWVADNDDCNDEDASVHPGADEICDGLDNDCDRDFDEDPVDATAWYTDADRDGFGDPDSSTLACDQPDGTVLDASDCDDDDRYVNPDADELCNGQDDDCDEAIDEEGALDPLTWYLDDDGDGFGQTEQTLDACEAPTGYTSDPDDCDDGDPTIHPGADEYCDTIDQDCDGEADDPDALDAPTWFHDLDGDGYGDPAIETVQCWESGDLVLDGSDCNDENAAVHPGADEICDGLDNDCDAVFDEDDALDAATWYQDDDGDGFGLEDSTTTACDEPRGFGPDSGDCDDGDPEVHPDAVQLCGDGIDNDCRGADTTCPAPGDLLITEIMKDPAAMSDSTGEWFEVYNASADTIELEGLLVYDNGGEDWLIDESLPLAPGDWAVLARSATATTAYDLVWSGFQLVNTEDEVILATWGTDGSDGEVIHEVWYNDDDWPDTAGASLSLDPDMFAPDLADDPSAWCAGQSLYDSGDRGTPGAANDDCP